MIYTYVVNIFFAGSFSLILGIVNTLQMILHLPIFNVIFPGNLLLMFEILIPVATFDFLSELELLEMVFPDSKISVTVGGSDLLDQMMDIGYDSYNPVLNLGTLFIFLIYYFLRFLVLMLFVKPVNLLTDKLAKVNTILTNQVFFSSLILLLIEGYIEFLISGLLLVIAP